MSFFFWRIPAENRKIFHEQEGEKTLVCLLEVDSPPVQAATAQALAIIAEGALCRQTIAEYGKSLACIICRVSGQLHTIYSIGPEEWFYWLVLVPDERFY